MGWDRGTKGEKRGCNVDSTICINLTFLEEGISMK